MGSKSKCLRRSLNSLKKEIRSLKKQMTWSRYDHNNHITSRIDSLNIDSLSNMTITRAKRASFDVAWSLTVTRCTNSWHSVRESRSDTKRQFLPRESTVM
jgi:hypothetical protein